MRKKAALAERSISDIISNSFNHIIRLGVLSITVISMLVMITGQYSACTRDFDVATGLASDRVYWALQSYKNIVQNVGCIPSLSNPDVPLDAKEYILKKISNEYGLLRSKIVNPDGYSDMDDEPIYRGDREYFQRAMQGEVFIQEPVISRTDGQLAIIGAAPLWKNGIPGGEIVGVVFISINPIFLHDIIEGVDISKNTFIYIIDHEGTTVAASDMDLVYSGNNNIINSETDPKYRSIANIERKMIAGETGCATIRTRGLLYYLSYTDIKETAGWSICLGFPYVDYIDTPLLLMILMGECLLISIFAVKIRSKKIADEVSKPVKRMTETIKRAAESGKEPETEELMNTPGEPIEMRIISEAMDSIMDRLDMVTTDNKEFMDSAVITDLISLDMLKYIHGYYKNAFGANVIVADSMGTVLVGKTNHGLVDATNIREDESVSFIMLNDRVIGSTIVKMPDGCFLDKDDAREHAIFVSKVLEMVAMGNFQRSLQHRNKMKNAREELEKIAEYHNEMSKEARKMASEAEKVRKSGNSETQKELIGRFTNFCYDILSRTDDFSDYNERSDISERIKEQIYNVDNLVGDLKDDMRRMHPDLREKIEYKVEVDMPKALFGDAQGIRRITENLILAVSDGVEKNNIGVYFESRRNAYATCLAISIHGNEERSDREREHLKNLLKEDVDDTGIVDNISASELKLLSIARAVRRMNGEITVDKGGEGEIWVTIVIPQLEVGANDQ